LDSTEVRVLWERRAVKEVAALPLRDRERILIAVEDLRGNPHLGVVMRAAWKGFRRLRVGQHRVTYAYEGRELLVSVVRIGHRRDIYR